MGLSTIDRSFNNILLSFLTGNEDSAVVYSLPSCSIFICSRIIGALSSWCMGNTLVCCTAVPSVLSKFHWKIG